MKKIHYLTDGEKLQDSIRLQRPVAIRIKFLGYLPWNLAELKTLSDAASRSPIQKLVLLCKRKKAFPSLLLYSSLPSYPDSLDPAPRTTILLLGSFPPWETRSSSRNCRYLSASSSFSTASERAGILKFSVSARF